MRWCAPAASPRAPTTTRSTMGSRSTRIRSCWHGMASGRPSSGAETLAKKARRAKVVSAFGTVPSEVLFDVFNSRRRTKPSLLYCGNDKDAKAVAAQPIGDVGFEPVDAGPLRTARYL